MAPTPLAAEEEVHQSLVVPEICEGAPHDGLPFGTRVLVRGKEGRYVSFKMCALDRLEHVVQFDRELNGPRTLLGDRCHAFRVVWNYSFGALCSFGYETAPEWSTIDDNGAGQVRHCNCQYEQHDLFFYSW